jgi:hypothetical protein
LSGSNFTTQCSLKNDLTKQRCERALFLIVLILL